MKKKRMVLIGFALFFLALLVGEAYCLLRGDLISILGVGVVLLIIAYLLLDAILDYIKGEPEAEMLPGMDWEYGQMEKLLSGQVKEEEKEEEPEQESEAERLQKAMYVLQKKSFEVLQKELQASRAQEAAAISELKEELSMLIKAEIKYERDNTSQIVNENRRQLKRLAQDLVQSNPAPQEQVPVIPESYQEALDRLTQQVEQIVELLQERPVVVAASAAPTEPMESMAYMDMEPEAEEIPIIPEFEEEVNVEPMVEDLMPEIGLEPEEELTEEDLSELIAGLMAGTEPEPEPAPVPAPAPAAPADPNKPLSPEEIAALFASMGQ